MADAARLGLSPSDVQAALQLVRDAPIRDESAFRLASAICAFRCEKNSSEMDVLLSICFL
jgi:hypothetical protein